MQNVRHDLQPTKAFYKLIHLLVNFRVRITHGNTEEIDGFFNDTLKFVRPME